MPLLAHEFLFASFHDLQYTSELSLFIISIDQEMIVSHCFLSYFLFVVGVLANHPPPSQDPFYGPPPGYESVPPGTILAHRAVPYPISEVTLFPILLQSAHHILYRTTDSFGEPITTVTTVLVPFNANPRKVLTYEVPEDSSDVDCAPSYTLQFLSRTGGFFGTIEESFELLVIQAALNLGWIVSVPDFQGPRAAFLANTLAAHTTLDSMRAVLASGTITGVRADAKMVMWGYSGGSLGVAAAAERKDAYAPELKILGAAAGGVVPNINTTLFAVNKGLTAGLIASGMEGLSHEYKGLNDALSSMLVSKESKAFAAVNQRCLSSNTLVFEGQDVLHRYLGNTTIFQGDTIATEVIEANRLGQFVPSIPLLIYKGSGDEISPIAETDKLVRYYCDGGASVEYLVHEGADHEEALVQGVPDALFWLKDILDGKEVAAGCSKTVNVTGVFDLQASRLLPLEIVNGLQSAFGHARSQTFD